MPSAHFGDLGGAATAVRRFVFESLQVMVLRQDCPPTINIDVEFSRFLARHGVDSLRATEVASEQRSLVRRELEKDIQRWSGQGVLTPFNFIVESEEVVVTWSHERFSDLTGGEAPGQEFVAVYEWLGGQMNREFLFPCLCFLKLLGCDPIFATDSPRDEGVDCIGLVDTGGLRSTAIFVQARSTNDLISGDAVLQESAKQTALPRTEKYMQYLTRLGIPTRHDGTGFLYAVLTNSDFHYAARQNASRLGVLLRSRRQLAQFLSLHTGLAALKKLKAEVPVPPRGDLTTNLAPRLLF